jgi:hypothetical protein
VLYKCLLKSNDDVILSAGNPKYLAIILGLFKTAPPIHRILLLKILTVLVCNLPEYIFKSALR